MSAAGIPTRPTLAAWDDVAVRGELEAALANIRPWLERRAWEAGRGVAGADELVSDVRTRVFLIEPPAPGSDPVAHVMAVARRVVMEWRRFYRPTGLEAVVPLDPFDEVMSADRCPCSDRSAGWMGGREGAALMSLQALVVGACGNWRRVRAIANGRRATWARHEVRSAIEAFIAEWTPDAPTRVPDTIAKHAQIRPVCRLGASGRSVGA